MSTGQYVLFAICAFFYVSAFVIILLTAGIRCVFCNRRIKVVRHEHYGAPVCEECWERLPEDEKT